MGIVGSRHLLGVRTTSTRAPALLFSLFTLLCLALAAAGCSAFTSSGVDEVEALELEVGECFNPPSSDEASDDGLVDERVLTVMVVPCSDPHDFEVYHSFDLEDGAYPGLEAVEQLWIAGCLVEFEGFVGINFDESELDISAIYPTEETWNDLDDREVLCSVTAVSGVARSGSAAGSSV